MGNLAIVTLGLSSQVVHNLKLHYASLFCPYGRLASCKYMRSECGLRSHETCDRPKLHRRGAQASRMDCLRATAKQFLDIQCTWIISGPLPLMDTTHQGHWQRKDQLHALGFGSLIAIVVQIVE